jgi:hypothetical protein
MTMSRLDTTVKRIKHSALGAKVNEMLPIRMKAFLRRLVDIASRPSAKEELINQVSQLNTLIARMMYEQALLTGRAQEPKRLLKYGFKVYSQHDEDGIIEEIFSRIGTTSRFFVEFGVGDGVENCTTYCLLKGWSGAWIDGSADCYQQILKNLRDVISTNRLRVRHSFITAENIELLFGELKIPQEFDLLSIDIDYNDFWVWKAIRSYRPRVLAIEYNASFKQSVSCTVPYQSNASWNRSNYYGCSLKALEMLGRQKGYTLVGCNYTGVTAFFVREDLLGNHFADPYTSENHYEPPRYFVRMPNGHTPAFGPMVGISESFKYTQEAINGIDIPE